MTSQRDERIEISVLLRAGKTPTEIREITKASRKTIYNVKDKLEAGESLERKPGSGGKRKIAVGIVEEACMAAPKKSFRQQAKDLNVRRQTISRNIKAAGGESFVKPEAS